MNITMTVSPMPEGKDPAGRNPPVETVERLRQRLPVKLNPQINRTIISSTVMAA